VNSFYNANQAAFAAAASSLANMCSDNSELVDKTMSTFTEFCPVLVRGLDSLSQLHPFIGIAAKAFNLVITMNLTRMMNDRKVIALNIQMQDTMMILFDLRHVRDPDHKDAKGDTVENRMSGILKKIADDITEAGSACDHYMKKSFVAKTLKSMVYEGRLAGYGDKFTKHREELRFALDIHTAMGVDMANSKLDYLSLQTESLQITMVEILRKLDTPREKEGKEFIEKQGGARACLQDDQLVQELIEISGEGIAAINARRTGDDEKDLEAARKKLMQDFSENLDEAFKKNLTLFERKLDMQSKQMQNFIDESLHDQGLLIVSALKAGAHDRILDPDIQALWKEHDWKGNVKARYFVLALHDYFEDKLGSQKGSVLTSAMPSNTPLDVGMNSLDAIFKDDRWALKYIDVSRVQAILEAIDDDSTGFISVKEVNTFVASKPSGWSLLGWIAYWGAGWHVSMVRFKRKIHAVIRDMYKVSVLSRNLIANRHYLDEYMSSEVFTRIDILLRSLRPVDAYVGNKLKQAVNVYSSSEEKRLRENLESVAYDIDTPETVSLVTGPGRVGRFILPLLYLLLKRHLKIFYLARTHILDGEELRDSITSLRNVIVVLDTRIRNLEAVFKQTVPDVSNRLSNVTFSLYHLSYVDTSCHPRNNSLRPRSEEGKGIEAESEAMSTEEIAQIPLGILKYGVRDTLETPIYQYSLTHFQPRRRRPRHSRHPLSGYWAGHFWTQDSKELYSAEGLVQISITDVDQEGNITGVAEAYCGLMTVSGKITPDRILSLNFVFENRTGITCHGRLRPHAGTLTGEFSFIKSDDDGKDRNTFFFSRTPAFAWRFQTPFGQRSKTARDRWSFAINAVLYQVQQNRYSWNYFRTRNAERRRFLELMVRQVAAIEYKLTPSNPPNDQEGKELRLLQAKLHPTDSRFYHSLVKYFMDLKFITHLEYTCDGCDRGITGSRFICLTCISEDFAETFDLCLNCRDTSRSTDSFDHIPSHAILKVDRVIQDGELAWAIPQAREIAARAKELFRSRNTLINQPTTDGIKDGRLEKTKSLQVETLCCCCGKEVSTPCWVCLHCSPDTYICDTCEKNRTPVLPDGPNKWHQHKHHLIRIHDTLEAADRLMTHSRLHALEGKLATVETKLQAFEHRFSGLEDTLKRVLAVLESLSKTS
ncbi:hypothetical protein GYMLUDRAFT_181097, partial [Collybiopsis luxurians FD-317 M1]